MGLGEEGGGDRYAVSHFDQFFQGSFPVSFPSSSPDLPKDSKTNVVSNQEESMIEVP